MKFDIKTLIPHVAALVVFVATALIYFSPQLEGKVLRQGDIIANRGMAKEATDHYKKTGEVALWTNSMFGGMPTYQVSSPQKNNYVKKVGSLLRLGLGSPAGVFLMGMLCFYICMLVLGVSPWVSLVCAVSFALGTVNMINYEAGHNTKVTTIMCVAPVLAGMVAVMRGRYLAGMAVFTFFLALAVSTNHLQMIYYLGLFCSIYMIVKLVEAIRAGTLAAYGKGVGLLVVGALLALGVFSSKLLVTNEYAKDTMRGKPILETSADTPANSSNTDGLEWTYAMQYSHNILDVIGAAIPLAAGGSSAEMVDKDSNFAKVVRSRKATAAPLYFGGLPPTVGVFYLGVILLLLFFLGAVVVRGPVKWWLLIAVILSVLMSMGRYASFVNWPLFEYLPYFNKFRAPNSVMAVTALLVPVLSALGLHKVITTEDKAELVKPLLLVAGVFGGFVLAYGLLGPMMIAFEGPSDSQYAQYPGMIDALVADRSSMLRGSAFRSFGFLAAATAALYFYLRGSISTLITIGIIGLLSVLDIAGVSSRYLSKDDFVSERQYKSAFAPRSVDSQILKDNDPHYRVHDLTVNTWNSASGSYFHKMIGGYNAAKLQRIEDIRIRYLAAGDQNVFNMLNTKYFIVPGADQKPAVQRNTAAMGNAWYVASVQMVENANAEIDALAGLDPRAKAVVHKEFSDYVAGLQPSIEGNIALTAYSPNKMTYKASGSGEHLAVFSEVWYGPNKGWQAYIDGQPVEHIRANYLLRALRIPAGDHEIVFEFKPSLYYTGEMISLIASLITLLLAAFAIFKHFKKD